MTRYIHTQITNPTGSVARKRQAATIPPFAFVGQLTAGASSVYQPTSNIMITGGAITSLGDGALDVDITVLKQQPFVASPVFIGGATLEADSQKVIFDMQAPVTAYDHIFVAAWQSSFHSNIVVQLVGVLI